MKKLLTWLKKPRLFHRILRKIIKLFFFEQWIILLSSGGKRWRDFSPVFPPKDRIWADPFLWEQDGKFFVFYEEQFLSTLRGRISCMALNEAMQIESNFPVLERPYHLSYPFLFEYNSQLYMLPESKESRQIELYRCRRFPHEWDFEQVLMANVDAVDSTLLAFDGKWWLFTTLPSANGSSWEELHLFFADSPLSTAWTPHPQNPIVQDVHNARSAGRIFTSEGQLIRPAQDCSVLYGYATNFNRILKLDETQYAETRVAAFRPQFFSKYYATHTWNESGKLRVIDAQMWRKKRG
jgi:hypothetical protein